MAYAFQIGKRYLRSKKRSTISVITVIAVTGVALGVAALLAVLSITSGFQEEFRDKVLGVNAHVLVLKYGVDFDEYRDVIARAREMPEVAGAGPFLINEMMLAKGDRLAGVLVKGVDPDVLGDVLDLPEQIVEGSIQGLRVDGARPPLRPDDILAGGETREWDWLDDLRPDAGVGSAGASDAGTAVDDASVTDAGSAAADPDGVDDEVLRQLIASGEDIFDGDGGVRGARRRTPAWGARAEAPAPAEPLAETTPAAPIGDDDDFEPLPEVHVASPEEVEAALEGFDFTTLDLSPEQEAQLVAEELEIMRRDEDGIDSLPGIIIGRTLARNVGIGLGDRVTLVSPLTGLDISMFTDRAARGPTSREFRVIAIFEAGFQEYDSRLVYTDLYEAQHFYNQGDSVTGVEMRVHDLDTSGDVARRLERELGGPFHTLDWAELNRNLFTALEIQKVMLSLVIATIIFVAAFNVIATLIMVVLEKKREVAILKAMGASDVTVLGIFMVQGSFVGLVGTAVGLLLGGGLVAYLATYQFPLDPKVYLIDHLPVVVSPTEFALTALIALGICTVATIAPSWWAARMLPVDGLRYD